MTETSNTYLSVIIPSYNEESRISETLDQILAYLKDKPFQWEIIYSDDGSTDGSVKIVQDKLSKVNHKILISPENKGKGSAVKQGMLEAEGEYLLFTDADLSTPIEEVEGFIASMKKGYDVVIGSRALGDSNVEVHQGILRESMGRIYNCFARVFAFQGINDSQCGFKCFKKDVGKKLFDRQKIMGFSFDAEIVFLAQRMGYKVLEAPVTWRNSPQSRVQIVSDPLKMFLDLIRIRWLHRGKH